MVRNPWKWKLDRVFQWRQRLKDELCVEFHDAPLAVLNSKAVAVPTTNRQFSAVALLGDSLYFDGKRDLDLHRPARVGQQLSGCRKRGLLSQGLGKVVSWCRSRQRLPALRERRGVMPAGFRFMCRVGSGARRLAGRAARSV